MLGLALKDRSRSGFEIAQKIRNLPGSKGAIEIIFITDAGNKNQAEVSRIPGCSIICKSPSASRTLVLKVQSILRDKVKGGKIIICYPHKLESICQRLKSHLETYNLREITAWSDHDLVEGEFWQEEIESALEAAVAAILIVDTDFMTSNFIQGVELPVLLRQQKISGTQIFPVMYSPTGTSLPDGSELNDQQFFGNSIEVTWNRLKEHELKREMDELARLVKKRIGLRINHNS